MKFWIFSINRRTFLIFGKKGKILEIFPEWPVATKSSSLKVGFPDFNFSPVATQTRMHPDPTRPESPISGHPPATTRTQTGSPPPCGPVPATDRPRRGADRRKLNDPFRRKTHRSPMTIPVTSGQKFGRFWLLSSPATHLWWLIASILPVHGELKKGNSRV